MRKLLFGLINQTAMNKKQGNPTRSRLGVLKTYKIYIGGKFPRTESGRYYIAQSASGDKIANVCLSSRKDFREAVVVARNAQKNTEHTTFITTTK